MTGQNDAGRLSLCLLCKRFLRKAGKNYSRLPRTGEGQKVIALRKSQRRLRLRHLEFLPEAERRKRAEGFGAQKKPLALRKGQAIQAAYVRLP